MSMFSDSDDDMLSDINMTPLIDVMLVLLIVFMVTLPVVNHAVKLELPRATSQPDDLQPAHIDISIGADGTVSWNGQRVDASTLSAKLAEGATQHPEPVLQLYADRSAKYEPIADFMAAAQRAGLSKLSFVTQPKP